MPKIEFITMYNRLLKLFFSKTDVTNRLSINDILYCACKDKNVTVSDNKQWLHNHSNTVKTIRLKNDCLKK